MTHFCYCRLASDSLLRSELFHLRLLRHCFLLCRPDCWLVPVVAVTVAAFICFVPQCFRLLFLDECLFFGFLPLFVSSWFCLLVKYYPTASCPALFVSTRGAKPFLTVFGHSRNVNSGHSFKMVARNREDEVGIWPFGSITEPPWSSKLAGLSTDVEIKLYKIKEKMLL